MSEWRAIPGYEGLYEVSDHGEVRSLDRVVTRHDGARQFHPGITLRQNWSGGYRAVNLCRDSRRRTSRVHQLVLLAFVGPRPEDLQQIRHLNGDHADNRLVNLKYGTTSENQYDRVQHGRHHNANKTHCKWGHEFTSENTIQQARGRRCRICYEAWLAALNERRRQRAS